MMIGIEEGSKVVAEVVVGGGVEADVDVIWWVSSRERTSAF